jgi:methionine-rich copper-binding protein CopC
MYTFVKGLSAILLLALAAVAGAHTAATGSTPKSGSILAASPPSIEITFKAPVRVTAVVVQQDGKPERKVSSTPATAATTVKIENPQLEPGLSRIRWTALSQDGHVVKGVIDLTVKPAAPAVK